MLRIERLGELLRRHGAALRAQVSEFAIGGQFFAFNTRPAIMGVINLSPDSWYRESVCLTAEQAIRRGLTLRAQGANIIDLGAESTLAQAARSDAALQNSRLQPVLEGLCQNGGVVSVETYSLAVAEAALRAGARVLNLTGATGTQDFYRLAAEHDAAVIICYVQGEHVRAVGDFDFTADPVAAMTEYFSRQIELAEKTGARKLFLDPGLGFYYRNLQDSAVRVRHQMEVFLNSFRLRTLGFPVCQALPHAFEYFGEEVRSAEPFFCVLAALGRTDLFRTHEVSRIRAVLDTLAVY
jgi:dihydropteroate synthase